MAIILILILVATVTSITIGVAHTHNSANNLCHELPSSYDESIAKNSTIFLLNTTKVASYLKCFGSSIRVTTSIPITLYQAPCNYLKYHNISFNSQSLEYFNATNPLPVVFDQRYQNYLMNANIRISINVTASNVDRVAKNLIYICHYTNYNVIQSFDKFSSRSYWVNYNETECSPNPLRYTNDDIVIVTELLNQSSPGYVFIVIGSTVDPLNRFQFSINVTGQTISNAGLAPFAIEGCSKLGHQTSFCEFELNSTDVPCIIASRPVDHVSREAFSNLTIKWSDNSSNAIKISTSTMTLGVIFLIAVCV